MTGFNDTTSILAFLKTRKSGSAKAMGEPGPTPVQLRELLDVAVRVPDHGKLTPWRFIVFEGDARSRIGDIFRARWAGLHPEHGPETVNFVGSMFLRAPLIIAVVSKAGPHAKIPEWEQQMSAGAVCYNIVLAALALGFAAQWQSDWIAYDPEIKDAMGLTPSENIAGFVYVGSSTAPLEERPRPDPMTLVTRWGA
jgi:nitroreductase